MKTISSVVENVIHRKPFLQSALAEGIINLTSLSRQIKPEIEAFLGKEVREGAIVMALKRLSEHLEFRATHKIVKVLKDIGEITVRSSLVDYTFLTSDSILEKQAELMREIQRMPDVFYTSSRGVNEINIVTSDRLETYMDELFKTERLTQKVKNLASVTVRLPHENVTVPGIYYFIFQRLAWEGIVLHEVISTTNEFTIIVDDPEAEKALKVIKALKSL
ncbi:MAG: aspartate kinase [Bacteroidetes bacterium]|nr:aspartate kinase [Bacteroidota bacterium]MDA0950349.1 aspartate kinase [Bacteroidota bacterium]